MSQNNINLMSPQSNIKTDTCTCNKFCIVKNAMIFFVCIYNV